MRSSTAAAVRRVAPPLLSTALISLGAGLLLTLLPLRFLASGLSPSVVGMLGGAEAVGFILGCLQAHRLIGPCAVGGGTALVASVQQLAS